MSELDRTAFDALCKLRDRYLKAMYWQNATVDDILFWKSEIKKIEKELNLCEPIEDND